MSEGSMQKKVGGPKRGEGEEKEDKEYKEEYEN